MQKSNPYDKLALIYDKLMSHVNYKSWADYLINLFQYSDIKIKTIIDLSCGTGSLLTHFANKKYSFFGCDISYSMISQVPTKINRRLFFVNDVKQIAVKSRKFDAVLFLYDSLNYLRNENQIERLFKETNRILNTGGVFIFDIITDLLCRTHYQNFEEEEIWENSGYIRHSFYDETNNLQHNDFRIKLGEEVYLETHIQKVFSEKQLSESLKKNGFEVAAQLDDFTFHQSNEESERIHYVCIKK